MTVRMGLFAFAALALLVVTSLNSCASRPPASDRLARQGWLVTVYYTAVESYHSEPPVDVTGCPTLDCTGGDQPLGRYPRDFVTAVHDEGSGRITSGPDAGRYLNWSHDVGYWLDTAPRDAHGRPLQPFRSAAADGLPDGSRLALTDCGRLDSGQPVPDEVCRTLRSGQWEVLDRFTPGFGGDQHIDLYLGEESQPHFTNSSTLYVTLVGARFAPRD
ncbi:MAG TPA: hypothetical protein VF163_06915 [Micromonosporaceae bacterium]